MSFPPDLDNVKAKTGKSPAEFANLATQKSKRLQFMTAVAWHLPALGHPTRDAHIEPTYSTARRFAATPDGSLGERL